MPRHRQKGAYTYKRDRLFVPGLAHMCRLAKRDYKQPYFETIRGFVDSVGLKIIGGASHNAAVHRLYQKVLKCRRPQPLGGGPLAHWSRYKLRLKK